MSRELSARDGDLTLAGTLWLPSREPAATVLMHPGSGPSDRENDVFFPPIREHFLAAGVAVASFDKRGVGGSTGRWEEAGIVEQASDAICCLDVLQGEIGGRIGLFGHSQGGWVVMEAAARTPVVAFVIASSGPGVTPERQERYAAGQHMRQAGIAEEEIDEALGYYDGVVAMMQEGVSLGDARRRVEAGAYPRAFVTLGVPVLPEDDAQWNLAASLMDYDPRGALERIRIPLLAVFGSEDPLTPVEESVVALREAVRPEFLRVEVFSGAGHRLEEGDPPRLAEGYLETLSAFIRGDEFRRHS